MEIFEDKVFAWIESNGLFDGTDRVLLAVSGGVDSVVMVHALHRLRQQGRLSCELVIGHVNHGLRDADSGGDEVFVKALAQALGFEAVIERVPVREYAAEYKLSIETAGRVLRLNSLATMAAKHGCDGIATAHHADDQAETLVHRLMRGTGFRGLCGIGPMSDVHGGRFIRPLLAVRRAEIIQYAQANDIQWRDDATNSNLTFTRNRIRHRLLPDLKADAHDIVGRLCDLSAKSQRFLSRVEEQAGVLFAKGQMNAAKREYVIEKTLLQDSLPWVFYEVMRRVLVELGIGLRGYTREHFDAFRKMIEADIAKADFPGDVEIIVGGSVLRICTDAGAPVLPEQSVELEMDEAVQFGPWTISCRLLNRSEVDIGQFLKTKDAFVEWFDADKITGPVEIRHRRDGDRFWPIGAAGEKKVGRFLQDAQLDAEIRQNAFVIADAENILWLAPVRMAELVKVTQQTKRILEIRIHFRQD